MLPVLELTRLRASQVEALARMLSAIDRVGESRRFHPHPFARDYLDTLCDDRLQDLYYVLATGNAVIGYGLLRGWDEGYTVPSLGLAIHPEHRRAGHGAVLMHFLHSAARARGANRVRLRVHAGNDTAIRLYRVVGYQFEPATDGDGLLVAYKSLTP
jgi:[ribosomal protein S18]-alanine N-acetyltransferase